MALHFILLDLHLNKIHFRRAYIQDVASQVSERVVVLLDGVDVAVVEGQRHEQQVLHVFVDDFVGDFLEYELLQLIYICINSSILLHMKFAHVGNLNKLLKEPAILPFIQKLLRLLQPNQHAILRVNGYFAIALLYLILNHTHSATFSVGTLRKRKNWAEL